MDADSLAGTNLLYREPALHDELMSDGAVAEQVVECARVAGHDGVRSVLDLGCGTARVLADLGSRWGWSGTGVDLQPALLVRARTAHPRLGLVTGDIRTVRLGATYDVIVSLGNTVSYLHTDAELAAAFATIAAHSRPGTVLAIATLTGAGRDASGSSDVRTSLGDARVDVVSRWASESGILTTARVWRFRDGRVEHDTLRRRFWDVSLLAEGATAAGFTVLRHDQPDISLCAVRPRA